MSLWGHFSAYHTPSRSHCVSPSCSPQCFLPLGSTLDLAQVEIWVSAACLCMLVSPPLPTPLILNVPDHSWP